MRGARPSPGQTFRGVRQVLSGRFRAQIRDLARGPVYLGTFATAEEAARSYDAAARRTWGGAAACNFMAPMMVDSWGRRASSLEPADE